MAAATLAAYTGVSRLDFVFDDKEYLLANTHVLQGISAKSLWWAFTSSYSANWHPLTWISHMADVALFGVKEPAGHHWTNLGIHVANVVLLFGLLQGLTGRLWRSAIVAALFGLHPLHVESVAWVSERKDVLSALFGLLALLAYLGYSRRPGRGRYLVTAGCFLLGLLAKPMLVTLPFVLLLLDFWPLGRWKASRRPPRPGEGSYSVLTLLKEKAPLFVLSGLSAAVTLVAQIQGGTLQPLDRSHYSLSIRLGNAVVSYARYLGKAIWPVDLGVYPHPGATLGWGVIAGAGALLAGMTLLALLQTRRRPYVLVGWLWYLGMLVPVIGLVQVGGQAMADRLTTCLSSAPPSAVVWSLGEATGALGHARRWRGVLAGLLALAVLWALSRRQVDYRRDDLTLWQRAAAVGPGKHHGELPTVGRAPESGDALSDLGNGEAALQHYREALRFGSVGLPGISRPFQHGPGARSTRKRRRSRRTVPGGACACVPDFRRRWKIWTNCSASAH